MEIAQVEKDVWLKAREVIDLLFFGFIKQKSNLFTQGPIDIRAMHDVLNDLHRAGTTPLTHRTLM